MTEKTEWEIVDAPPSASSDPRQTVWHALRAMLGPWWRWKLAATTIVAALTLAFFVALTGAMILVAAATAAVAIGIGRFRRWMRRDRAGVSP